jgi:hypothetical protein
VSVYPAREADKRRDSSLKLSRRCSDAIRAKGYSSLSYRFWREQVRASQSTLPVPQVRVYRSFTCKHLDSDGREFDLIRKQLGLFKGELAMQHGISRQSLYRCIWDGPSRLVALAILRLWKPGSHGELFEEVSEPEEGMLRIPKGRQGKSLRQKEEAIFVETVAI